MARPVVPCHRARAPVLRSRARARPRAKRFSSATEPLESTRSRSERNNRPVIESASVRYSGPADGIPASSSCSRTVRKYGAGIGTKIAIESNRAPRSADAKIDRTTSRTSSSLSAVGTSAVGVGSTEDGLVCELTGPNIDSAWLPAEASTSGSAVDAQTATGAVPPALRFIALITSRRNSIVARPWLKGPTTTSRSLSSLGPLSGEVATSTAARRTVYLSLIHI